MQITHKKSIFQKVLAKSRASISATVSNLFAKSSALDKNEINNLQDALIQSDFGIDTAQMLIDSVSSNFKQSRNSNSRVIDILHDKLVEILEPSDYQFRIENQTVPHVILMVGVNGVGKTTTVAKIGSYYQQQGYSIIFAACDTFRPAAIEQLETWGRRLDIPVISQSVGADPAAVAHDAMHSAIAKKASILVIDTSGRQQTRDDLMRQLGKIHRIISKIEPTAPHETLISIDAGTGQNAISQVKHFNDHTPLSGICVTKLDGTAKGGIVVTLNQRFSLPIVFVGTGESVDHITPFKAKEYVDSLLGSEN